MCARCSNLIRELKENHIADMKLAIYVAKEVKRQKTNSENVEKIIHALEDSLVEAQYGSHLEKVK